MNKLKLLSDAKQAINVLQDIKKCEMCSYYLTLIQNHAKEGHKTDKATVEKVSPQ